MNTKLCAGLCYVWVWVEKNGCSVHAGFLRVRVRGVVVYCVPGLRRGGVNCAGAGPRQLAGHGWGWGFAGHRTCGVLRCRGSAASGSEGALCQRGHCAGRRSFRPGRCGCHGAECIVSNVVAGLNGQHRPGRVGAGPGRSRGPEAGSRRRPHSAGFPAKVHAAEPPRCSVLAVNHSQRLGSALANSQSWAEICRGSQHPWSKPPKVAAFTDLHVASRTGLPQSKQETRVH